MLAEEEFATPTAKPHLEKAGTSLGRSLSFMRFNDTTPQNPLWHYHSEIELVYIESGNGKRHIGNHISYFTEGELLMIGSNLPHYGYKDRFTSMSKENVIRFDPKILEHMLRDIPEIYKIKDLIERSKHGLSFHGKTKKRIGTMTNDMAIQSHFEQFLSLLRILKELAETSEFRILNAAQITLHSSMQDHERMGILYRHVTEHFRSNITLSDMSQLTNMTIPSFCRFFKKQTGKTFTQFVNEIRITHACKLLSETSRSISDICFDCGFNNFAHFNKQFKKGTEQNPSQYRAKFKQAMII